MIEKKCYYGALVFISFAECNKSVLQIPSREVKTFLFTLLSVELGHQLDPGPGWTISSYKLWVDVVVVVGSRWAGGKWSSKSTISEDVSWMLFTARAALRVRFGTF